MSIHRPKHITSDEGLGAATTKSLRYLSNSLAIGTEIWPRPAVPWRQGNTIIADLGYFWITRWEVGKPYIITKFYDDAHKLAGVYCDVARPVRHTAQGFAFDDLYLDVWQMPGSAPEILDEDELAEALRAGYVTPGEASQAGRVANELLSALARDDARFHF